MKRVNRIANSTRDEIQRTADRMTEIMRLITGTQDPDPRIEWSALTSASAMVMAASVGIKPTPENLSAVLKLITSEVSPAVEKLVKQMKARA
jgi:hypothetical protein